jgi:pyruvate dehydrogenase E2 component (dihydrolipoamide acetyltransferase)
MSRFEFKLPDIGEGVTEGEVVSWLVGVGDAVAQDQDMVEVMTDKATVTIGAPRPGKVAELRGNVGDVVPVGAVLVVLELGEGGAPAEEAPRPARSSEAKAPAPRPAEPKEAQPEPEERDEPEPEEEEAEGGTVASAVGDLKESLPGLSEPPPGHFDEKPLAAPATRKLARELGVDLHTVKPSGPGGRITREDVEQHRSRARPGGTGRTKAAEPTRAPREAPRASAAPVAEAEGDRRVPIRGLRRRIYENMSRSKHTAAHFTYVDECDVSALKAMRARAKAHADAEGSNLTFLPFIIKAVVGALRRHPTLNCLVDDAAQEMILRSSYDIGIAVATDAGLTVPVLRHADRLSMLEIQQEVERLSEEARAGKIRREDLGGSGFTITSLGKLGGLFATPVVNYPEVAILGIHEMKRRPVIRDEQIVIADVMHISLSFDHRIIDGHVGAAFAQEVKSYLENPDRLVIELR